MEKFTIEELKSLGLTEVELTIVRNIKENYAGDVRVMELLDRYVLERVASSDKVRRCKICGIPVRECYEIDGEYACDEECAIELYGDEQGFREEMKYADEIDSDVFQTEFPNYDADDVYRSDV